MVPLHAALNDGYSAMQPPPDNIVTVAAVVVSMIDRATAATYTATFHLATCTLRRVQQRLVVAVGGLVAPG
jgi:hypothetical protein